MSRFLLFCNFFYFLSLKKSSIIYSRKNSPYNFTYNDTFILKNFYLKNFEKVINKKIGENIIYYGILSLKSASDE